MSFPELGLYPNIDTKLYFSAGQDKEDMGKSILSKSLLWAFNKNPRRWLGSPPFTGTAATRWGSLIDCLLLTPDRFDETYVVAPETYPAKASAKKDAPTIQKPWNANATYCKKWLADNTEDGRELIKSSTLDEAQVAVQVLRDDPTVSAMLSKCRTQTAMVGTMTDEASGMEVTLKGLIDIEPDKDSDYGNSIIDLKTTGVMDTPTDIMWNSFKLGYHEQAGLYRDLYNSITGENRTDFWFIFQQSTKPYEVVIVKMAEDAILKGREIYMEAVAKWCDISKTGEWPSPFDDMTELDLPEVAYRD